MAGLRTTRIIALIFAGDFAAKLERIILLPEKDGPKEHIAYSDMVTGVLKDLPQVSRVISEQFGQQKLRSGQKFLLPVGELDL